MPILLPRIFLVLAINLSLFAQLSHGRDINVTATESGKRSQETLYWADYLFNRKPVSPGHWNYEIDYRGRGGSLDKWVVNYNSANEQFEATVTRTPDEP